MNRLANFSLSFLLSLAIGYNVDMAIRPELREELLRLSAEEREELAEELYESLSGEVPDPAWEALWSDEIARRVRDVTSGAVELVDADDLHAEIRRDHTLRSK
jgi:putative addiction module component (TIGR02574 family)